ncbi:DUF1223 domain-containing protein [Shimia sp. SDUM112013]|uniref:DUF1223 domain-containing protein n=1 Tax=Shimia sp. SDUM112013 TaxID=3136160 RepID=UPI0032EAA37A
MKRLAAVIIMLWCATTLAAQAETRPVVVELYTSQGCSSCPPADAFFHNELSAREDVIALALHVDYWDYIGWKDSFANPAYTKRQKAYAVAAGHRSVYTPQLIIGGRDHVVGNKPDKVNGLIEAHKRAASPVRMAMRRQGGTVWIEAEATGAVKNMVVHLVRYKPEQSVDIKRGENAGKTLTYTNIVDGWDVIAEWDGRAPLKIKAPARGDNPVVALIQETGNGPILAAARIR